MLKTLLALLESKKFVTAILSSIAIAGAHWGFHVDVTLMLLLLTPVMVAIGAQGWADSGKEAAKINAANGWKLLEANPTATIQMPGIASADTAAAIEKRMQSGLIGIRLMLAIALVGVVSLIACSNGCGPNTPTPQPVIDVIDCTKLEASNQWMSIVGQLEPDVAAHDWSKLVSDTEEMGKQFGVDIARCVGEELIQQYLSAKQAGGDTWQAHDAADQIRKNAGGATFKTKYGPL